MGPRLTFLVDVDDVVADLVPYWVHMLERETGCPPVNLKDPKWDTWSLTNLIDPVYHEDLWRILDTRGLLYKDVVPIEGADEGIDRIRTAGHRVVFVTSATCGHAGEKLEWLVQHGFLDSVKYQKDYVECADKSLIRGDVLIDDRPDNLHTFGGFRILFMPRPLRVDLIEGMDAVMPSWKQLDETELEGNTELIGEF